MSICKAQSTRRAQTTSLHCCRTNSLLVVLCKQTAAAALLWCLLHQHAAASALWLVNKRSGMTCASCLAWVWFQHHNNNRFTLFAFYRPSRPCLPQGFHCCPEEALPQLQPASSKIHLQLITVPDILRATQGKGAKLDSYRACVYVCHSSSYDTQVVVHQ
jgi:hypothetical protein